MKIVVVGLGYVGLSNAVLLAQHNEVIGVDISKTRVDMLNGMKSPIVDAELSHYLTQKALNLRASTDLVRSVVGADYVIVATPTNYNEKTNSFDIAALEDIMLEVIAAEPNAVIVVKSTIPIGFIDSVRARFKTKAIMFSPEFLREGSALIDNLYPSRIIIGDKSDRAKIFADLLLQGAIKKKVEKVFTGTREAEAIKLFSNTYLAMRVAFFNELDSFALKNELDCREIINGVSLDPRVGNSYNNPSFGYGGYCLPKDTRQLLANYENTPQNLIGAIIQSNITRKKFILNVITSKKPKVVGIFGLEMKKGSDNFRESSVLEIINGLDGEGIEVIIYEPKLTCVRFLNFSVEPNLQLFKSRSDIIVANRCLPDLEDVQCKVFTRDLFNVN